MKKANDVKVQMPRTFRIGNSKVRLRLGDVFRAFHEELFVLRLDPDEAVKALERLGFQKAILAFWKGEVASFVKPISDNWELHVRVYPDGLVTCEYEISRIYLQHLFGPRIYSCYELYGQMKEAGVKAQLEYKGVGPVTEIEELVELEVPDPPFLLDLPSLAIALGLTTALALTFLRR